MAPGTVLCRLCHKSLKSYFVLQSQRISLLHPLPRSCQRILQYSTVSKDSPGEVGTEEEEDLGKPYSYSKSKAANWTVDKSFGSQYSRPWWKVAPLSLALCALIAWIFLREETEIDQKLEVKLSERLPDLFKSPEVSSSEVEDKEQEEKR